MAGRRFIATTLATVLILSTSISQSHVKALEALLPPTAGLELGAERRPEPEPDFDEDPEGVLHPSRVGRPITRLRPFANPHIYGNVGFGQTEGDYVDMNGLGDGTDAIAQNHDGNLNAAVGNEPDDNLDGIADVRARPAEVDYANRAQNRPDGSQDFETTNTLGENTRGPVADAGGLVSPTEPYYVNAVNDRSEGLNALNGENGGPEAQTRGQVLSNEPYYANTGQNGPNQGQGVDVGHVTDGIYDDPDSASDTSGESFHFGDTDEESEALNDNDPFQPFSDDPRFQLSDDVRSQPSSDNARPQMENTGQRPETSRPGTSSDFNPPYDTVAPPLGRPIAAGEEHGLQGAHGPSDGEVPYSDVPRQRSYLHNENGPRHSYETIGWGSPRSSLESSHSYETIPPSLPRRNGESPTAQEASHGVAAGEEEEEEVVEYVYLCSTRKVSDIKEMGGVFPRGYRPHGSLAGAATESELNFQFDEYFHGAGSKTYVVAYKDFSDAAQVAADWPIGGKVRVWKIKTTANMFPESIISRTSTAEGERFLAFGGVHKGQMAGYYKLGRESAEQIEAVRNGVPPKKVGFKYVENRGYRAQQYGNERHVLTSELTDDRVAELRATLMLPTCREGFGGPSKRSTENCVWREGRKDWEGGEDADSYEGDDILDLSEREASEVPKIKPSKVDGMNPLDGEKSRVKVSEADDMNLWDRENPSETVTNFDYEAIAEDGEAMAIARFERGDLVALADGLASKIFTDLVKRLKLKLPKISKGTAQTAGALRNQLAQVASIKTWSSSRLSGGGGSLTLAAAVTTSYVYDLVRTWRDKEATRLDKMVVSLAFVPIAGCSVKAISDTEHGAIGPTSTSLCFVADALLFTPLAPLALFIHAVRGIIDRVEQQSIGFIVRHHDAGWRNFYKILELNLRSDSYRSGVINRYVTELSIIAFDASEQLGMLEAGEQLANRTNENLHNDLNREREEALKKMCGNMRYKKLWYENWLAVNMSHYVREQAADYTARFMEKQTSQALEELESERRLAIAQAVRYPQPTERAERREAEVKQKLKHLAIQVGILKREDVEDYVKNATRIVSDMVQTINFTRPELCDCPTLVEEIDLLTAIDGTKDELEHGLLCSASRGYDDVVERILNKALFTVDVNCVDEDGNSALLLAAAKRHSKVVDMLLRIGHADPDLVNKRGETAASLEATAAATSSVQEKPKRRQRIDTTMPDNHYTTKKAAEMKRPTRRRRIDTSMPDNSYALP